MNKLVRLTESDLHRIVKESVGKILNEVQGWSLEKDDVTWVNDAESGASDKAWMVKIWPGLVTTYQPSVPSLLLSKMPLRRSWDIWTKMETTVSSAMKMPRASVRN